MYSKYNQRSSKNIEYTLESHRHQEIERSSQFDNWCSSSWLNMSGSLYLNKLYIPRCQGWTCCSMLNNLLMFPHHKSCNSNHSQDRCDHWSHNNHPHNEYMYQLSHNFDIPQYITLFSRHPIRRTNWHHQIRLHMCWCSFQSRSLIHKGNRSWR